MTETKAYKLSIPKKYEDKIAQLAREQNMKPTRFLTSIIEDALNIETRTVGNPDIDDINRARKEQKMERILAENPDSILINGWYKDIDSLSTYNGLFTPDWDDIPKGHGSDYQLLWLEGYDSALGRVGRGRSYAHDDESYTPARAILMFNNNDDDGAYEQQKRYSREQDFETFEEEVDVQPLDETASGDDLLGL